jgi:Zn-dependent protease
MRPPAPNRQPDVVSEAALSQVRQPTVCSHCGTELAPDSVACPACRSLVHAERLKALAVRANTLLSEGKLVEARTTWDEALELLPAGSQQHTTIQQRVAELTKQIASDPAAKATSVTSDGPWWKRGGMAVIAIAVLFLGKFKFLILGLTKAKTFFSMFAFFGVYWAAFGWKLALGIAITIYIHEMGHVAMLRRLKIEAGAPMFIPGVGAYVLMKRHIQDPVIDAKVGLAGPIWGLGAGLASYVVFAFTGVPVWKAIAQLTAFLNLFNLIPVWQLDGSRGFHALSSWQRSAVVGAIAIAFYLTSQKLLLIVGAVAVFRAFQKAQHEGDARILATFVALIGALSALAHLAR